MHRLFWKIFFSFWAALIVFAVATILAASNYLERMRAQQDAPSPHARMINYVREAQSIADESGVAGLKSWLQALDRREAIPLLLVDFEGQDLLGREVPAFIAQRLNRRSRRPPPMFRHPPPPHRRPIQLADGSLYRLIPDFQSVTLGRILQRPRVIALPLLVAAVVSGFVCLLLARYLTAPIGRLQSATKHLASGDLSQRVTPSLGSRKDELADLAKDFDFMASRLDALLNAQKRLLHDVSHELRSPLARLRVAAGLARQRPGRAESALERIERETERLDELVGQVLALSRLEAGVGDAPEEYLDLAELLHAVAEDAAFEAETSRRRVELASEQELMVRGHTELLRRAFENVVRNAVNHTADGTAVEFAAERDTGGNSVKVSVCDRGSGIPDSELDAVFEPFFRASDNSARGGYGLGLAIARRAIEAHGGAIHAENRPDGGLCVHIRLPLASDLTQEAPA